MRKSKHSIREWLNAINFSRTPKDDQTDVVRVNLGEVVEVVTGGRQNFGSGHYSAGVEYAGNEPRFVTELADEESGFITRSRAAFLMNDGSVIHVCESDEVGEGREWRKTYVCATNEAISAAVEAMRSVYEAQAREVEQADRAGRLEFARQTHQALMRIGFSAGVAARIMHAAGPSRALVAVEWASKALAAIPSVDALDMVICGRGGSTGFGKDRRMAALRALGIEPPEVMTAGALEHILLGAQVALMAGLPEAQMIEMRQ